MDPCSAIAGSLQVVTQCAQCTMAIAKWVGQVRTVDERISAFYQEVSALQANYRNLSQSLEAPNMIEAARSTDVDSGGQLWIQISTTLQDCEATMIEINRVLDKINSSARIGRPVLKQLKESLVTGDLQKLRERIQLFNTSLALPLQMISLTMQISQRDATSLNQRQLESKITMLQRSIQNLSNALIKPHRSASLGGSTAIDESLADRTIHHNMENYVEVAKKFLYTASAAASSRSGTSTVHQDDTPLGAVAARRGSGWGLPMTEAEVLRIDKFVQNLPDDTNTPQASDAQSSSAPTHETPQDDDSDDDDDDEVELMLVRTYLKNGQNEAEQDNYPSAEDNFREALNLLQVHDFGSTFACGPADVTLMLAQACTKQSKFDEAIALLVPLTETQPLPRQSDPSRQESSSILSRTSRSRADRGQSLTASHMLGEVYMKKSDFINAENHSLQAFKGRRKLLGPQHPKFLESVNLVIDLFHAKGQEAKATAYREFLKPSKESPRISDSLFAEMSRTISSSSENIPASLAMDHDLPSQKYRRPTFSIPFRRTERFETTAKPPPTSAPRVSFSASSTSAREGVYHTPKTPGRSLSVPAAMANTPQVQLGRLSSNSITSMSDTSAGVKITDSRFLAIQSFCKEKKHKQAIEMAMDLLKNYDQQVNLFVLRRPEIEKNIRKGQDMGLAATGQGFAPIHFFCSLQYEATVEVEFLIEQGVDVDAVAFRPGYNKEDPFTPLTLAINRGYSKIVKMLLEASASVQSYRRRTSMNNHVEGGDDSHVLLLACRQGYVRVMSLLLQHNARLVESDFPISWYGNSLLHDACWRCDTAMVRFLLKYQDEHQVVDRDNQYTAIGRLEQQDKFGKTPLMYAVVARSISNSTERSLKVYRRLDCIRTLLDRYDQQEDRESEGKTASNKLRGLDMDLYIEDKKGRTVFWYVDEEGDEELRQLLEGYSRNSRLIDL